MSINKKKTLEGNTASSSFSKHTMKFTDDRVCNLIGANGTNKKLIEKQFQVKINIENKKFIVDEKDSQNTLIDVEIECTADNICCLLIQ
jgi:phosphate starvation-inducible protein PhoH